jgi:hypothetical protein
MVAIRIHARITQHVVHMTTVISSRVFVKLVILEDFVKLRQQVQRQLHYHHQPRTSVSQILALTTAFVYQIMDVLLVAFVHLISAEFIAKTLIVRI